MQYKKIITKTLAELPAQLKSYEKRMRDGLNLLNNLKDKKTINLIELIRKHPAKLLTTNKQRYLKITATQIKNTIMELIKINLTHATKNPEAIRKSGISPFG